MEDQKLNEKQSLELISNMIKQANNHMALGVGNTLISWGVILFVVSIVADIAIAITHNPLCMWIYFAIPLFGCPLEWWLKRKATQKDSGHVKTYIELSLEKVWKCIGGMLLAYPLCILLLHASAGPRVWIAMFFLGMFLPSIGSYITGVMLKSKKVETVAGFACAMSLIFLGKIVESDYVFTFSSTYIFPLCAVCALILPGIWINRMAEEDNE